MMQSDSTSELTVTLKILNVPAALCFPFVFQHQGLPHIHA